MSHSIKLAPALKETVLEANHNQAPLSYALFLGAIQASKSRPNTHLEYGVNDEGLQAAIEKSSELVDHVHSGLSAINKVLAYSDLAEITNELPALFWLMNGLTELAQNVSIESDEIQYVLNQKNSTHKKTRKVSET